MKKLLAYIFLAIFSFQVLPVKELGKILFKSQLAEEIKECDYSEEGEALKLKKEGDPFFNEILPPSSDLARLQHLSHTLQVALHEAERLPISHVTDIFTPPPNC